MATHVGAIRQESILLLPAHEALLAAAVFSWGAKCGCRGPGCTSSRCRGDGGAGWELPPRLTWRRTAASICKGEAGEASGWDKLKLVIHRGRGLGQADLSLGMPSGDTNNRINASIETLAIASTPHLLHHALMGFEWQYICTAIVRARGHALMNDGHPAPQG